MRDLGDFRLPKVSFHAFSTLDPDSALLASLKPIGRYVLLGGCALYLAHGKYGLKKWFPPPKTRYPGVLFLSFFSSNAILRGARDPIYAMLPWTLNKAIFSALLFGGQAVLLVGERYDFFSPPDTPLLSFFKHVSLSHLLKNSVLSSCLCSSLLDILSPLELGSFILATSSFLAANELLLDAFSSSSSSLLSSSTVGSSVINSSLEGAYIALSPSWKHNLLALSDFPLLLSLWSAVITVEKVFMPRSSPSPSDLTHFVGLLTGAAYGLFVSWCRASAKTKSELPMDSPQVSPAPSTAVPPSYEPISPSVLHTNRRNSMDHSQNSPVPLRARSDSFSSSRSASPSPATEIPLDPHPLVTIARERQKTRTI